MTQGPLDGQQQRSTHLVGGNHVEGQPAQEDVGAPLAGDLPPVELVGEAGELALARHGDAVERLLLLQAQRVEERLDRLLSLHGGWLV